MHINYYVFCILVLFVVLYFTKEFRDEGFTGQQSDVSRAMEKFTEMVGGEKKLPEKDPANTTMQNGMNPAMNTGTKY